MVYFITWWVIIQVLGLAALPLVSWVFRWLPGRGYAFSKPAGLLLASYILWLGASLGFLRNDLGGILFAVLLTAAASAYLYLRGVEPGGRPYKLALREHLSHNRRMVLAVEVLFTLAFLAFALLRAYNPDKIMTAGGEKFMEITFLNGVLNSAQFPPLDPWLSGFAISYYYFGYVMMALMTRLSGVPATVGFELYNALLIALTSVAAFGVVYSLVTIRRGGQEGGTRQGIGYGLLGALLVAWMGNLEGALESLFHSGVLPDSFWTWLNLHDLVGVAPTGSWIPGGGSGWWWWRASRVLTDYDLLGRPLNVSPITEFPFFSFLLGDNHPHVMTLPFVLVAIGLGLNLLQRTLDCPPQAVARPDNPDDLAAYNPVQFAFGGNWGLFLFYALALGSLGFLNTWDLPIYIGLVTLAYGVGAFAAARRRLDWELAGQMLLLALGLLAASLALYVLFYLSFSSQAGGVLPYVFRPTRLPQYLVIFGPFIFILAWFLVAFLGRLDGGRFLRAILTWWGGVMLAALALFLLALSVVALAGLLGNPTVQSFLGDLTLGQAAAEVVRARLANPWLFLLLTLLLALSLAAAFYRARRVQQGDAPPGAASDTALASEQQPGMAPGELFALLLVFVGLALTLSTELFYLRDDFGVRMNTVFKFYYQGWVMLACASAYAIWWLLARPPAGDRNRLSQGGRAVFAGLAALLILAGMVYPAFAIPSRANGFRGEPVLDGANPLRRSNPDDFALIDWLSRNALPPGPASWQDLPVILEAPGKSYNYEGRISAFTGLPAVLGWALHEAQWRGNYDQQGRREPDILTIYTTRDPQLTLELLHQWNVRFVVIGPTELSYIQTQCQSPANRCTLSQALAKFENLLPVVFEQGQVRLFEVR